MQHLDATALRCNSDKLVPIWELVFVKHSLDGADPPLLEKNGVHVANPVLIHSLDALALRCIPLVRVGMRA
jgi:hypothetical protein